MRQYLLLIFFLLTLDSFCQTETQKLVGDWKLYLKDNSSFEFLRLNSDGTGLKCFGQTINGKDSLFINHITTLIITKWKVDKDDLVINSDNTLSFAIEPRYHMIWISGDEIRLDGEHLIFYLYPSNLNRQKFKRSIAYKRASSISGNYGVDIKKCISTDRELVSFKPLDSIFQIIEYKGYSDLIPHIVGCNVGFEYVQQYYDPPYLLTIPRIIKKWSFGFGNRNFYISFNSEKEDTSETSIAIYYDFDNEMKNYYFSQIQKGVEKKDIARVNNQDVYKTINWQGKYEGKIFLKNSIVIAYYTKDFNNQIALQKSITSFRYK